MKKLVLLRAKTPDDWTDYEARTRATPTMRALVSRLHAENGVHLDDIAGHARLVFWTLVKYRFVVVDYDYVKLSEAGLRFARRVKICQ